MEDDPIATWKSEIKWFSENNHFKDLNRIDGMPTEREWKIFRGVTALDLLEQIQSLMRDLQCEPENFQRQDHLHVNVHRHCVGRTRKNRKGVNTSHRHLRIMLANSRAVIGLSWGLDQKKSGTERTPTNPTDLGSSGRRNDVEFLRFWSSDISCHQCL